MSSFFTTPASQKKRKRAEVTTNGASKKRNTTSSTNQSARDAPRKRKEREESITGSESESGDERDGFFTPEAQDETSESEAENETAAERRLKLAERYLENIRNEIVDEAGFDAADIDRDLIAERLKEDVAETKGKIYRHIAAQLDFGHATRTNFRADQNGITGCAACLPYAWTISKDMKLVKWEIADPKTYNADGGEKRATNISARRRPKKLKWRWGNKNKTYDSSYLGHTGEILAIAVSDSGKYLATGDRTARLIIWEADTLKPLKLFTQHRDAIISLSFRRGTHQLFSASADRTIKIWSASELAYVETLFGHQDSVVNIAGGLDMSQETCVSVGSRDRTARLWKVVEESQLVFRGGGLAKPKGKRDALERRSHRKNGADDGDEEDGSPKAYAEGSIDCVALLDSSTFVTGSDNGALSLWSMNKKKPLFTLPLAHGRDPPLSPEEMSADIDAAEKNIKSPRLPRWITALTTVPFADLILSASWDGCIRAWRVGPEKRTIEAVGTVGRVVPDEDHRTINGNGIEEAHEDASSAISGIVNGLAVAERGDRGKDGICIVAAVGKEPRLGRWKKTAGRNYAVVFEVHRKSLANGTHEEYSEEDE